jgi:Sigma-70, region 4
VLYDRHASRVYGYLLRRTASWSDAEAARYRDAVAKLAYEDMPDHAESIAQPLDDEREATALEDQIRRLPRHQRKVVELCLWTGLDQQAAAVLGVAVGTVKSRLSRARSRLAASAGVVAPRQAAHSAEVEGSRKPLYATRPNTTAAALNCLTSSESIRAAPAAQPQGCGQRCRDGALPVRYDCRRRRSAAYPGLTMKKPSQKSLA